MLEIFIYVYIDTLEILNWNKQTTYKEFFNIIVCIVWQLTLILSPLLTIVSQTLKRIYCSYVDVGLLGIS